MATLADRLRPPFAQSSKAPDVARAVYDGLLILAASGLIALAAQAALPIPFSPVPVTGQTLALLLLAAALGRTRAAAAALCYLTEGAAGWPVFAGGSGGAHVLIGPTGGYLAGFVPAAWLVGALAERGFDRRILATALIMIAGNVVVLVLGAAWLSRFVGPELALALGVLPFLPGDLVKVVVAAALLPLAWKALGQRLH